MGGSYMDKLGSLTTEQHHLNAQVLLSKGRMSPTPLSGGPGPRRGAAPAAAFAAALQRWRQRHPILLALAAVILLTLAADVTFGHGGVLPMRLPLWPAGSCMAAAHGLELPAAFVDQWKHRSRPLPPRAPALVPSDWRGPVNKAHLGASGSWTLLLMRMSMQRSLAALNCSKGCQQLTPTHPPNRSLDAGPGVRRLRLPRLPLPCRGRQGVGRRGPLRRQAALQIQRGEFGGEEGVREREWWALQAQIL
jgi:hypothetical protein